MSPDQYSPAVAEPKTEKEKPRIAKYGWNWGPSFDDELKIEFELIRRGGYIDHNGKKYGNGLFYHFREAQTLCWPEDVHHRWSDLILKTICEERLTVVCGARDCVAGSTRIWNPVTGESPTIESLYESQANPIVMTTRGPIWAGVPFIKGIDDLYEVVCENGSRFTATAGHYVSIGPSFVPVGSLRIGQSLISYSSGPALTISAFSLSALQPNELSCLNKDEDSKSDCLAYSCSDDEQLRPGVATFQDGAPSLADAPGRSRVDRNSGAVGNEPKRSHRHQSIDRHSSARFVHLCNHKAPSESPLFPRSSQFGSDSFQQQQRSREVGSSSFLPSLKSSCGGLQQHYSFDTVFPCTKSDLFLTRVQSIKRVGRGKFYDLTVPIAHHYFAEGLIHHNTGKTRGMAKWGLIDYWLFPEQTLTLVSSTGMRELELRIWGDIKSLFRRAKENFPWLPGKVADKALGIFTDLLEDTGNLRDMRRGIIGVPCVGGDGEWVGIDRYCGIKQKRRRLLGDEVQFMAPMYVDVLNQLDKGDFKGVFVGNPIGGNGKALDKISEPIGGWASLGEVTKTKTWRHKYDGVTINLVGTDSPNFDPETLNKYPFLINQTDADRVALRNGRDSSQFWTLIMGVRKTGADAYRVLTMEMCERHGAFNTATWFGSQKTRIYAIDAGFGGDPCEVEWIEFGSDINGINVIEFHATETIPISVSSELSPEDQIALYVKGDCAKLAIPDENIFFDAGMRASLAVSMARIISPAVNAVNFGGPATDRPVNEDLYTVDVKTKERRLVKCVEQYSKFVTEMAFSVRELVEAGQARNFPKGAAEEFSQREWRWVPGPIGPRYELETKPEFKARNTYSPNKADVVKIAVEGARRLGFVIKNPKVHRVNQVADQQWLEREVQKYRTSLKARELTYK